MYHSRLLPWCVPTPAHFAYFWLHTLDQLKNKFLLSRWPWISLVFFLHRTYIPSGKPIALQYPAHITTRLEHSLIYPPSWFRDLRTLHHYWCWWDHKHPSGKNCVFFICTWSAHGKCSSEATDLSVYATEPTQTMVAMDSTRITQLISDVCSLIITSL